MEIKNVNEKLAEMTEELKQYGERLEAGRQKAEALKESDPEEYERRAVEISGSQKEADKKLSALQEAMNELRGSIRTREAHGPNRKERRRAASLERQKKNTLKRMHKRGRVKTNK